LVLINLTLLLFSVLVVAEDGQQQGSGSLLVSLDQLGPLAITAAKKLTFGTGRWSDFSRVSILDLAGRISDWIIVSFFIFCFHSETGF
jgi:hypothetical protein